MIKSGPYHVEFLTWNTHLDVGEGLGSALDAKNYGGNFGHASVEISFPYGDKTEEWVDQYCRSIELYRPEDELAREQGEVYKIDVPVFYTTTDGQRIFDPKKYKSLNPAAEIVTHVYLSWVPGKYAAQRDERDPFQMKWRSGFELYTSEQDRNMEYVGHAVEFKRGLEGYRELELDKRGGVEGSKKYITRGINNMIHMLTEDEVRYFSLTPSELKQLERLDPIYSELDFKELESNITHFMKDEFEGKSLQEKGQSLQDWIERFPILAHAMNFSCAEYRNINPEPDEDEDLKYYMAMISNFIENDLETILEDLVKYSQIYIIVQEQRLIEKYIPFVSSIEANIEQLQNFIDHYDSEIEKMRMYFGQNQDDSTQRSKYPVFFAFYGETEMDFEDYLQSDNGFKKDLTNYLRLREKIVDRFSRQQQGLSTDSKVILPISTIEGSYEGHKDGLNVERMLKAIPEFVANGKGYSLEHKNCSDFANHFGYAGAPLYLRNQFNRAAIGWFATPQIVNNSALNYGNIIYDSGYEPGTYRASKTLEFYLNREKQVAGISKQYNELKEKISFQDARVNLLISILKDPKQLSFGEYEGSESLDPLLQGILEQNGLDFEDFRSLERDEIVKKVYQYCNHKYQLNIANDRDKVYTMIKTGSGYYKEIIEKDASILDENAVKSKMKELYGSVYGKKPFIGKSKILNSDFKEKGDLYLRACHTIIYENSLGNWNLTDPNFVSMEHDRVELSKLKKKLFVGMFGLLRMRMAANIFFRDSMNADEPWFELNWASHHSRGLIDNYIGMENSRLRLIANIARVIYLGYSTIRQAVLIAPRRYLQRGIAKLKSKFINQRSIDELYSAEKGVDILHELKSGRTTVEKIVKAEMTSNYIKGMSVLDTIFSSSKSIRGIIDDEYNRKTQLFDQANEKIRSQLPNDVERIISKSIGKIEENIEKKRVISERSVSIHSGNIEAGLKSFEEYLDKSLFPYFDEKFTNRILKNAKSLDKVVSSLDERLERQLGKDLIADLVQFDKMSMIYLGTDSEDQWGSMHIYDMSDHPKVVPDTILNEKDPLKIADFLVDRINEMKEKGVEVDILKILTSDKISKLNSNQLKAIIQYLAKASSVDRLNKTLRMIVEKSIHDINYFTVSDYVPFKENINRFESFLLNSGLDDEIVKKLTKNDSLQNLFIKLSYEVLSARSAKQLVKFSNETIDPSILSKKQIDFVNYQMALEIRNASEFLGRGAWSGIPIASRSYLEHDVKLKSSGIGRWGKEECIVQQEGLRFQPPKRWHIADLTLSRERSPIKASFISPSPVTMQNPLKDPKEIFLVFHEKYFESDMDHQKENQKRLNFSNASLMARNRHDDFKAISESDDKSIQDRILQCIREQIISLYNQPDRKPDALNLRLTIGGEGLGGLDAQLVLAAIAADLNNENGILSKFKDLSNINLEIDLVTLNSAKANASIAVTAANNLATAKSRYPNISFHGVDIQHGTTQEKLGEQHVLAQVSADVVKVEHQSRSRKGDLIHAVSNDSPRADHRAVWANKMRNGFGSFFYSLSPFRLFHNVAVSGRGIFNKIGSFLSPRSIEPINKIVSVNDDQKVQPIKMKTDFLDQELMRLYSESDVETRLRTVQTPPIENLVFEGGGVKGLVYAGALSRMAEAGLYKDVKRVAGSSAGGIVSTLLAMGYPPEAIEKEMLNISFKEMMDSTGQDKAFTSVGEKLWNIYSLFKNKGIYKGEKFLEVLSEKITNGLEHNLRAHFENDYLQKTCPKHPDESLHAYNLRLMIIREQEGPQLDDYVTNKINETKIRLGITDFASITFGQHHRLKDIFPRLGLKDLYLTATLMETGTLQVFSHETHPNMQVRHATRATMSFPGAFMPFEFEGKVYADGGIANNYPMSIFDQDRYLPEGCRFNDAGANPGSLGFLVDSQSEINERWGLKDPAVFKKLSLPDFLKQLVGGLHNRADELHRRYHTNSIQIFDEGVPTMDLEISDASKSRLITSGYQAMDFYVSNYRSLNVVSDTSHFESVDEKYKKSRISEIEFYLKEIDRLIIQLEVLRESYRNQSKEYDSSLDKMKADLQTVMTSFSALEDQDTDEGKQLKLDIDNLNQAINTIKITLDQIDTALGHHDQKGVIDQCIERLNEERIVGLAELNRRKGPATPPSNIHPVMFSGKASSPPLILDKQPLSVSQSAVVVPDNSAAHFKAAKIVLAKTDFNTELQGDTIHFEMSVEDTKLTATIQKEDNDKLRYAVDLLPTNEQQMKQVLSELYDVMFQSILETEADRDVTLDLQGAGPELQMLEAVLNDLKETYKQRLDEKKINIRVEQPRVAAGISQA